MNAPAALDKSNGGHLPTNKESTVQNHIRFTLAIIAMSSVFLVAGQPAHAERGSNLDPAEVAIMPREAQMMAHQFVYGDFMQGLPRPHWAKVEKCHGGLLRWHCPFTAGSKSDHMRCSAVLWLSADAFNYYYTYHRLRCHARA